MPLSLKSVALLKQTPRNTNGLVLNITPDSITQAFEGAVRAKMNYKGDEVNFLHDIRFHDLRHEATSRLAKLVPNIIELSRITDHKDVQMLKHYCHTEVEDLAKKLG